MSAEFGIVVALRPDIDAGARQVDASLESMEVKAKETGAAIGKAVGGGFAEAAIKAKAGDTAARAFVASTEAATRAANDERRVLATLAQAFGQLEAATLPAVRAERDYAAAEKLAADAVKAGIATEEQARAVLTEKAKALEQVTVAQADAADGMAAYDDAVGKIATSAEGAGFSLKDFGRTVGDIMQPIGAVNNLLQLGATALNLYHTALKAAAEGVAEFIATGDPQGTLGKELVASREARATDAIGYVPDALFAQIHGNGSAAEFEKAIADYKATHQRGLQVLEQADAEYKAYLAGRPSENKYREEQAWVERLAAKGRAEQARKEEQAALAAHRDPRAEAAALVAAQAEIERTSPWNELAADIAIVTGRLTEANAAALEWIKANEDTYEVSPWDDLAGDIATVYSKVVDLADVTVDTAKQAQSEWSKVGEAFAGPTQDALGGLIDGLVTLKFSFEDWARSALEAISRVIIQMMLLEAIKAGFSNTSGGIGGFLWKVAGGKEGGASARMASGDPFGGAGGGAPIIATPVERPTPGGGSAGGGQGVQLKVVVVSNERDAARELLEGPEGERVVLAHTAKHRGKLGALGR